MSRDVPAQASERLLRLKAIKAITAQMSLGVPAEASERLLRLYKALLRVLRLFFYWGSIIIKA